VIVPAFHQTFTVLPPFRHPGDARIQANQNARLMVKRHSLFSVLFLFGVLVLSTTRLAAAEEPSGVGQSVNVSGNWQLSWVARLGTEKATVRFQQDGTNLTGVFHGNLGSPTVTGTVRAKTVTFTLEFTGKYPFTLTFSGPVDADKMSGKFSVGGVVGGYDPHGESAHPTDYSWQATRIPDQEGQSAPAKPDHTAQTSGDR
jgi:hypothetical protein